MHISSFTQRVCFGVLALATYTAGYSNAHALTSQTVEKTPAANTSADAAHHFLQTEEYISYQLPYPGMLPNHLLYPLKIFRDRMLDALIRDPIKRIEYNILMADKRVNMGVYLTDQNEYELAEGTVSKGEKYMVRAVDSAYTAKQNNHDVPSELVNTISLAIKKHQHVIEELIEKSPEHVHAGYKSSLQTASESAGRIADFNQN